jgi:hypothetical protein
MDLATLQYAPELELPQGAALYRVQLSRARKTSLRIGPLCLAPLGSALTALKRRWSQPLVDPLTGGLHRLCAAALTGSQIPLWP